ncbi:hypothetical protein AB0K00_55850 [Dactylosporangium sp. NPDC049525]|uniref:hypothetical protein n=1 Tax=Dactylosporangium sp. NPDC049525 TaxID=3154730 RepID=UPI00343F8C06
MGGPDRRSQPVRAAAGTLVHGTRLFEPARWRPVDGTWISDGYVSARNPFSRAALDPDDLRRVSEALRPAG